MSEALATISVFGASGAAELTTDPSAASRLAEASTMLLAAAAAMVAAVRGARIEIESAGQRSVGSAAPKLRGVHESALKHTVAKVYRVEKATSRFAAAAEKALRRPATLQAWLVAP